LRNTRPNSRSWREKLDRRGANNPQGSIPEEIQEIPRCDAKQKRGICEGEGAGDGVKEEERFSKQRLTKGICMARGPRITEEEVNKARELKAQGLKIHQIAAQMKRSEPTIYKLLRLAGLPR
jgi:hypothetical protein